MEKAPYSYGLVVMEVFEMTVLLMDTPQVYTRSLSGQ